MRVKVGIVLSEIIARFRGQHPAIIANIVTKGTGVTYGERPGRKGKLETIHPPTMVDYVREKLKDRAREAQR